MANTAEMVAQLRIIASTLAAQRQVQQLTQEVGRLGTAASRVGGVFRGLVEGGAGYGIGRFLESTVGRAAEFDGAMAHIRTASGATAEQIAADGRKINEIAGDGIITNIELAKGVYNLISAGESESEALKNVAIAQKMVEGSAADAADAQNNFAAAARLVGDEMNIWKDAHMTAAQATDTFSKLQRKYDFTSTTELIEALKVAGPAAHAAGVGFNVMNAALAVLSENGIHSAEAGVALREVLSHLAVGKELAGLRVIDPKTGGLDVQATLERLKAVLPPTGERRNQLLKAKGFDIRSLPNVDILIDNAKEMAGIVTDLSNSAGAAADAAAMRMAAPDMVLAQFAAKWSLFTESIGASLLGPLGKVLDYLNPIVKKLYEFSQAHVGISEVVASFMAFVSAVAVVGGAVQFLGVASTFEWIARVTQLTRAWAAAQWILNAAMDANPLVLTIAAAVALGVAAYEVTKHWGAVVGFFRGLLTDVTGIFQSIVNVIKSDVALMYNLGHDFVTTLANGMLGAAMAPVRAAEAIAHRIGRFFVGHSPIPEGALHDMDLGGEIARSMRPGPVISAVRQMAAAAALAIPLSVMPAMGAVAPATHARASETTLAMHSMRSSESASAPIINNNIRVTVNGSAKPADVKAAVAEALAESTNKIAAALKRHQHDASRRDY